MASSFVVALLTRAKRFVNVDGMNKNPHAVALGRKGGKARLDKMTEEQRKESARKAGNASAAARKAKSQEIVK